MEIVSAWRKQGWRFLRFDEGSNTWQDEGDDAACAKCFAAFRDYATPVASSKQPASSVMPKKVSSPTNVSSRPPRWNENEVRLVFLEVLFVCTENTYLIHPLVSRAALLVIHFIAG